MHLLGTKQKEINFMTNNPLDLSYWKALGVTAITINVEDSQSLDDALQRITQIITDAAN